MGGSDQSFARMIMAITPEQHFKIVSLLSFYAMLVLSSTHAFLIQGFLKVNANTLSKSRPSHNIMSQNHYAAPPIVPHENDILLGRGGYNNRHIGNQKLRELARAYSSHYQASSKKGKASLSRELVQQIHLQNPPGRFLKKEEGVWEDGKFKKKKKKAKGAWVEVNDEYAKEKVSQVLRDAIAGVKSYKNNHAPRYEEQWRQQHGSTSPASFDGNIGTSAHFESEEFFGRARRPASAPPLMHSQYQNHLQPAVASHHITPGRRLSFGSDTSPKRGSYQTNEWMQQLDHEPTQGRYSYRVPNRQSLPPIPTSPLIPSQVSFDEHASPSSLLAPAPSLTVSPNRNSQPTTHHGLDELHLLNCDLLYSDDDLL